MLVTLSVVNTASVFVYKRQITFAKDDLQVGLGFKSYLPLSTYMSTMPAEIFTCTQVYRPFGSVGAGEGAGVPNKFEF